MVTDIVSADLIRLGIEIVCFFILLVLSGFFSSSETSLFSLKQTQLETMRRSKTPGHQLIEKMLTEPRRLIVTILIGNELVNITASALSAAIIIRWFGSDNVYLNLLVVTPMLLIFGEITPKTFAFKNNVAFATFEAPLIQRFAQLVTPVRIVIRSISDGITTLIVGKERTAGSLVTQDMVLTLTREAVGDGVLQTNEAHYINQIFKFGEARVEDVMTPRSNVQFISHDASPDDVITIIKSSNHSKLPVYKDDQDNVIGVLFGRDLLAENMKTLRGKKGLKAMLRESYFIPGTRQVIDLFHHFRSEHISMALVLDEYGGVIGLVTMDDLLRCIFGDLPSSSAGIKDSEKRKRSNSPQTIDALMPVTEFNKLYHCQLPTTISNTMNGLFMHHYGELPKKGTQISMEELMFSVESIKGNRIKQLKISQVEKKSKGTRRKLFARKEIASTAVTAAPITPATIRDLIDDTIETTKTTKTTKASGSKKSQAAPRRKPVNTKKAGAIGKSAQTPSKALAGSVKKSSVTNKKQATKKGSVKKNNSKNNKKT